MQHSLCFDKEDNRKALAVWRKSNLLNESIFPPIERQGQVSLQTFNLLMHYLDVNAGKTDAQVLRLLVRGAFFTTDAELEQLSA